jgi:hypothetical protein
MSARSQAGASSVPARRPTRAPCRRRSRLRSSAAPVDSRPCRKWSSGPVDAGRGRAISSGRGRQLAVVYAHYAQVDRVDVPTIQDAHSSTAVTERERAVGLNNVKLSQPARRCGTRWQSRTGSFLLALYAPRSDGTQSTPVGTDRAPKPHARQLEHDADAHLPGQPRSGECRPGRCAVWGCGAALERLPEVDSRAPRTLRPRATVAASLGWRADPEG